MKINLGSLFALILLSISTHSVSATVREYWIAADEVIWDYAPSFPANLMSGKSFTNKERIFVENGIGRQYLKSIYREYTENFAVLKTRRSKEKHLGILGPIIRAEVGDQIVVHFKNNTKYPASIHPHGVFYNKANEGTPYDDGDINKADDIVAPGAKYTYIWAVPERSGPGPKDPSSIAWIYHGHVNEPVDTNTGLVGVIIITQQGKAKADGSPKNVDREFITLYTVFDENSSLHLNTNLANCKRQSCNQDHAYFSESNLMHAMNGLVYGNNQGYLMKKGELVRWYILAMGTEVDLHTPHWHGATLLHNGNRLDVIELMPAATKTLDMHPDVKGTWMYHCHINDHISAGMMSTFKVE